MTLMIFSYKSVQTMTDFRYTEMYTFKAMMWSHHCLHTLLPPEIHQIGALPVENCCMEVDGYFFRILAIVFANLDTFLSNFHTRKHTHTHAHTSAVL